MIRIIRTRFAERVTLGTLAARLGRQPGYLGGLFRREMGCSVQDYVIKLRMRKAAQLIRKGAKVDAVTMLVGYRSPKNFYLAFKRHFGTTPGRFRSLVSQKRPAEASTSTRSKPAQAR